jgi:L-iditol 2-dehydrogenase
LEYRDPLPPALHPFSQGLLSTRPLIRILPKIYRAIYLKAAVLHSPGDLRVEEIESPKPRRGSIVARVLIALTCGTDVKLYRRGHPFARLPNVIGHEFVGVVEDLGEGVPEDLRGRVFVTMNTSPCGVCFYCVRGRENLCERLGETIIGFTVPGAYAEMIEIPERIWRRYFYQIPPGLDLVEAAFLEPLSTVVHGQRILGGVDGEWVAVIGSGPIGLMHLQLLKLRGLRVAVIDRHWEKLDVAKRLGADIVVNSNEERPEDIARSINSGKGFDAVVEAAGKQEAWELAIRLVRSGGKILFFGGLPRGTSISIDSYRIHYEEIEVKGAFHTTPRDVDEAYKLIEGRRLRLRELVSGVMPLERVRDALESMGRGAGLKYVIKP